MHPLRRIPRSVAAVLVALTALILGTTSARALLYDLDFSTPPHTVGLPPTTGSGPAPRETVSSIFNGTPTVVASHGPLTDQPCRFENGDGAGDQIVLRLDDLPASNRYLISADVVVTSAAPDSSARFTMLIDAPSIRTIRFQGNGAVRSTDPASGSLLLASYTIGQLVHLEVGVDLTADTWSIRLDGDLVHEGPFGSASAVSSVRFTTELLLTNPLVAAVDNVRIDENIPTAEYGCDRLTFGDLVLNQTYNVGQSFISEGVFFTVLGYSQPIGPCADPLDTGGFVKVVSAQGACGLGKELLFNNANVDFGFDGVAREVTIPYGEWGGTASLSVNGDCRTVQNLADLDGTNLGGVSVSVFPSGNPDQSCGILRLGGEVTQLAIGGQEFYIDGVSYCEDCADLRRSAFDDQVIGAEFHVGDSFASGAATHTFIHFFPPGTACVNPDPDGFARIGNAGDACGSSGEIWLNNINDLIDFGSPVDWLVLNFGEYGGNVNFGVNDDCRNVENLSDLTGTVVGGAHVWVVDYGTPGQSCGVLYVTGLIESFGIGGQEFFVDNIRTCPNVTMDAGQPVAPATESLLHLAPARPNPVRESTSLAFTLTRPAPVRLTIYNVAGRAVRTLVDEERGAGLHQVAWDGRDEQGRRAPAGIYACRLEAGAVAQTRSIVVLD